MLIDKLLVGTMIMITVGMLFGGYAAAQKKSKVEQTDPNALLRIDAKIDRLTERLGDHDEAMVKALEKCKP